MHALNIVTTAFVLLTVPLSKRLMIYEQVNVYLLGVIHHFANSDCALFHIQEF